MKSASRGDVVRRRQRKRLALWMEEWRLYKALGVAPVAYSGAVSGFERDTALVGQGGSERARKEPLCAGQVRLLKPPRAELAMIRPVFVVLLRTESDDSFLVVPFSRFVNPAVPGEWGTDLRVLPLRVLCIWNTRVARKEVLSAGWPCGSITAVKVVLALDMWRLLKDGALPGSMPAQRNGPPLEHPLDPRHEYLQEERELLDMHLGVAEHAGKSANPFLYEDPRSTVRLAAEDKREYGSTKKESEPPAGESTLS